MYKVYYNDKIEEYATLKEARKRALELKNSVFAYEVTIENKNGVKVPI